MVPIINRRDLSFMLYELLDVASLCEMSRYEMHDLSTFEAVLDVAHKVAVDHFEPHAAKLDAHEPTFDGKTVHIIPEVKEALDAYVEAGLMSACFDERDAGAQLPYTVGLSVAAMFYSANISTSAYVLLTQAAANLLGAHANDSQRARYMLPMLEGRFFGTMCLSEPHAGSSLADLRTTAEPTADPSLFKIRGDKMWISGGEHGLSQNIVHLVLAKLPGAPAGVRGISLFIVPRNRLREDGSPGPANGVRLVGLNHKMGYRGTINTVLSFGDEGDCLGELVGEANHGLRFMFNMMNEARIGVGLGAAMLGYAGYLHSLDYARQRPQGRHPDEKDPEQGPVMIIEHADVRRMLLAQKAYVEGGLSLCLFCAHLVDTLATTEATEPERRELGLLLDLLTPIAKAWPSQWCLKANELAIQVLGGYGYTRDYPVERFYRDNRLNPIHEGTNGIQALDLLGRKAVMHGGAALKILGARVLATIAEARSFETLAPHAEALERALETATETTMVLMGAGAQGRVRLFLANASVYLDMMGHIVVAWMWLKQATVAAGAIGGATPSDRAFYEGKLRACRYFFGWELPSIGPWAALLSRLDETCLTMPPESF